MGPGCETLIEVEPEHATILAIRGFFHPGQSAWRVEIQPVLPLGASPAEQQAISDANVTVWHGEDIVVRLSHREHGLYEGNGPAPEAGQAYRLDVDAPGYPAVKAQSRVPNPVADLQVAFEDSAGFYASVVTGDLLPSAILNVSFNDASEEDNYYSVKVSKQNGIDEGLLFQSQHPSLPREKLLDVISTEGVDHQVFDNPLFTDDLFDGDWFDADLTVARSFVYAYRVQLRHLSEDMYRYDLSQSLIDAEEDNPFAEPVVAYTNVEGGVGVFAGYLDTEAEPVVLDEITPALVAGSYNAIRFGAAGNVDFLRSGGDLELHFEDSGSLSGQVTIPAETSPAGIKILEDITGHFTLDRGFVDLFVTPDIFLNRLRFYYEGSKSSSIIRGIYPNPDSLLITLASKR